MLLGLQFPFSIVNVVVIIIIGIIIIITSNLAPVSLTGT